jgi:hypothetical protein
MASPDSERGDGVGEPVPTPTVIGAAVSGNFQHFSFCRFLTELLQVDGNGKILWLASK